MVRLTKLGPIAALLLLVATLAACGATSSASTSDGDGKTRTVEHALGTSEVPVDPQRIVVLDSAYLMDNLVALGYGDKIVGRADLHGVGEQTPTWLEDDLNFEDIAYLGSLYPDGPDLDAIAELEPDLVIGVGSAFFEKYDEISKFTAAVAPVMAEGFVVGDWVELATATGEVMGKSDEAAAAIAGVEDHLQERVSAAPEGMLDRTLTTLGGWIGDPQLYYSSSPDVTWLFENAGFDLNPGFPDSEYELLSPELYPKLEADVLAIADFAAGTIDYPSMFGSDSVLSTLSAVQNSQLVIVDGLLLASSGPVGMPTAIDEVFDQLEAAWQQ